MATELVLGLVLGAGLVGAFMPMKGIVWYIRELQARVSDLEERQGPDSQTSLQDTFPNRKENS